MSFHPLQSYKHLCNRLESNSAELTKLVAEKERIQKALEIAILKAEQDTREINEKLLPAVADKRSALIAEGRDLLPMLRGFGKCYENLRSLL